jgi:TPR repeat protein
MKDSLLPSALAAVAVLTTTVFAQTPPPAVVAPPAGSQTPAKEMDAITEYNIGMRYLTGERLTKSATEAVDWFRKAADQGYAEALKWLRRSADQGNPKAEALLGQWYSTGVGVVGMTRRASGGFAKQPTRAICRHKG